MATFGIIVQSRVYDHLPYFTLPRYEEIQGMFAPDFHKAQMDEERKNIKRLA